MPVVVPLRPVERPDAAARAAALEAAVTARAEGVDETRAWPGEDIAALAEAGLLAAPLPAALGGEALGLGPDTVDMTRAVLACLGRASLTVGRLFEGHLNAVKLVARYGGPAARRLFAGEIGTGGLSGVWNAERGRDPTLLAHPVAGGWRLRGHKIHCSGAGHIRRPLVTARPAGGGEPIMLLPDMTDVAIVVDTAVWRASGMRGTATGTVTFADVFVPADACVGEPGDYYRPPLFLGGAWRVLAVQLGGLDAVQALHAAALERRGQADDPVARARFAEAAGLHEAARLLVREAALRAEDVASDAIAIGAYVDLARATFDTLAHRVLALARQAASLSAYIAPDPLDRVGRDLETYLRQPALDASRGAAAGYLLAHGTRFG